MSDDECKHGLVLGSCTICKHGPQIPMREARCRSCGAAIVWAVSKQGKRIPLDAEPSLSGNLVVVGAAHDERGASPLVGHSMSEAGETRYLSHFVTCPEAPAWRKGR